MTENYDRAMAIAPMVQPEPDTERRAMLYVAGQAQDVEDCRLLLDALGLLGRPVRSSKRLRDQQKKHRKRAL